MLWRNLPSTAVRSEQIMKNEISVRITMFLFPVRFTDPRAGSVVSARIWLCLYWFDHQYVKLFIVGCKADITFYRMSLGTGRPIILRDETSVRHCRLLLTHPMASPTDVRLVSLVELIAQKSTFKARNYSIHLMLETLSANLRNFVPFWWSSQP